MLLIAAVYLWPVPQQPVEQIYAQAPGDRVAELQAFRLANPPSTLTVDGVEWEYLAVGDGPQAIL